jgi:osmotically-inducible protein OsmY
MKTLIAAAVAAAFAVPAYAQNTTLPNAQERAQNREAVQDKANEAKRALPSASERAENREAVKEKTDEAKGALPSASERAENRERASGMAASAALTTKVKTALASDVGMRTVVSIDVDSNDGVVTLKGKVPTADAKKKAEEIAKKVDGVKSVKNQLTVEPEKKS